MQPLRLAVATRCFDQPLRAAIQSALDIGAQGVRIDVRNELKPTDLSDTGRRQFLHETNERGIQIASVMFPARRPFSDQEHLEDRVAAVRQAMQFAWQLRAQVLTCRVGRLPTEKESPEYRLLVEVVNDLARYGNHVGTVFAVTPTHDTAERLLEFVSEINAGPVGVDFDPAHFAMTGQDAIAALRMLHAVVRHVQLRDGLRDIDGSGLETPLGRGEVVWDELLATLGEMDYRGWLTAVRTQGDDKPADVARALQYVRRVALGG